MGFFKSAAAAAVALNSALVTAITDPFCPAGDSSKVCFRWGVPEAEASADNGSIYFQLRAPAQNTWVGLGIGDQMKGAEIFLMYQDGDGNVTVSPREGNGHFMPMHVERPGLELLGGSGVMDGEMIANVRCSDCTSLDLMSTNSGWIAAWLEGEPLNEKSPEAQISFHGNERHVFNVDLTKATTQSEGNPFLNANNNTQGGGGNSAVSPGGSSTPNNKVVYAHGIMMSVVMIIGYPLGSMLMPLIGKWYIHASWQTFFFLVMWAAFGLGYSAAHARDIFFKQSHTRLGIFVVCLMSLQPIFGLAHHMIYKKKGKRTILSHVHTWYGRCIMILGIVNGGLGLRLATQPRRFLIAYIVVAAVVGALYIATIGFGLFRKSKRGSRASSRENLEPGNKAKEGHPST